MEEESIEDFMIEFEAKGIMKQIEQKAKKDFVPEYDGMRLVEELLPIKEAIDAGKESELYKHTEKLYKIVKRRVMGMSVQDTGGKIGVPTRRPGLDEYDSMRDVRKDGEEVPYEGRYGKF